MAKGCVHYNYFRDYDPGTGRYIESDPIGLGGGLNTYLCSKASPNKYIDPTGNMAIADDVVVIGGGILIGACIATNCTKPISGAIENTIDKVKKLCDEEPKCDPPEGTICSDFHADSTPHKTKDIDGNDIGKLRDHVHIWQMNKAPNGCYWNKVKKETYNYTPVYARACSSYPSWVAQEGR